MKKIYIFAVFLLLILSLLYVSSLYNVVTISGKNKTEIFFVKDGCKIELEFIHSVELFKYKEIYEVRDGKFILRKALTKSFGWGLPSGGNVTFENDYIVFKSNRTYRYLYISTHSINDYTIKLDHKTLKLDDFGNLIKLKVDEIWPWTFQRLKEGLLMKENYLAGKPY